MPPIDPYATLFRMELLDSLFVLVVVMFSAVIHEVMHGYAADKLGDPTARYAGRLTLNPIPHLDLFGSVILPLLLTLSGSPLFFGWAKPVPYNPYNLIKAPYWGEAIVAFAGPLSNFALALVAALLIRIGIFPLELAGVIFTIVVVNVMLGFFNLIPIPPLDGSKILSAIKQQCKEVGKIRIELTVDVDNMAAIGLYKKAGFETEGIVKKSYRLSSTDRFYDEYLMACFLE